VLQPAQEDVSPFLSKPIEKANKNLTLDVRSGKWTVKIKMLPESHVTLSKTGILSSLVKRREFFVFQFVLFFPAFSLSARFSDAELEVKGLPLQCAEITKGGFLAT
jgi:hypothetical protein